MYNQIYDYSMRSLAGFTCLHHLLFQMGSSTHEGVKVPFQLPPGMANECQMTFYVKSFLMPQKLRGTVTYMAKVLSIS